MSCHQQSLIEVRNRFPGHSVEVSPGALLNDCWAIRLVNKVSHLLVVVVFGEPDRKLSLYEVEMVGVLREAYPVTSVYWLYVAEMDGATEFCWENGY